MARYDCERVARKSKRRPRQRIAKAKTRRTGEQQRRDGDQDGRGRQSKRERELEGIRVEADQRQRKQASAQDRERLGDEFERVARQSRVAGEVRRFPNLRPGGVDADRQDREDGVDDSDPKILGPVACENESLVECVRRGPGVQSIVPRCSATRKSRRTSR
jgi:hypothetical protein